MMENENNNSINFEREFDNPFEEWEYKQELLDKEYRKIQKKHDLSFKVLMAIFFIFALYLLGTFSYELYKDFSMKNSGKDFCSRFGFRYSDSKCIENLDNGKIILHEINYFDKSWAFVEVQVKK